jgi:glucan phosphoethanolaminetransferase (alkaline phosphatase superfamily)
MSYIKTMTQQKLSFLLALYIGLFMNSAVFYRRFDGYAQAFTVWKGLSAVVELVATVLATFFLLRVLSLFGRRAWRVLASLVVLFSAAASYYMTFLNVDWLWHYRFGDDHRHRSLQRGGGLAALCLGGDCQRYAAVVYLE